MSCGVRFPGVAWVGTVGVGVAASGVEYIDEPALVLMIAPLPRQSFRLFSGLQPLPATSSGFIGPCRAGPCRRQHARLAGVDPRAQRAHGHRLSVRRAVVGAQPYGTYGGWRIHRRFVRGGFRPGSRPDLACDAGLPADRTVAQYNRGRAQFRAQPGRQARARLRVARSGARPGPVGSRVVSGRCPPRWWA